MAALTKGTHQTYQPVPESGEVDTAEDGLITGVLDWICESSAGQASSSKVGTRHPMDSRLICYRTSRKQLKNSKELIHGQFMGLVSSPTIKIWEPIGTLSQDSIVTHKDFVTKIGGKYGSVKNKAVFNTDPPHEFIGFPLDADEDLGGVSAYLIPTVSFRCTYYQNTQPSARELGTIEPKPPFSIPSNVKEFLLSGFNPRPLPPKTGIWQVSEELMGSGPKGWLRVIYSR